MQTTDNSLYIAVSLLPRPPNNHLFVVPCSTVSVVDRNPYFSSIDKQREISD